GRPRLVRRSGRLGEPRRRGGVRRRHPVGHPRRVRCHPFRRLRHRRRLGPRARARRAPPETQRHARSAGACPAVTAAPAERGSPFAAVAAFIDALYRAGVTEVCVSPGSRSTPLAELAARHAGLNLRVIIDERSAAFFALGIAKASRRPAALICTSGTAAANYYPALVEARYGRTPLIVLTADRPPEARGIGSPQTIDQLKLYADHVKSFTEMPVPSGAVDVV